MSKPSQTTCPSEPESIGAAMRPARPGPMRPIRDRLYSVERDRNVKILYACENGSRAYDCANASSDYDVHFIYVRPIQSYLGPMARRDVIEPKDIAGQDAGSKPDGLQANLINASGWDILKALELATRSNPTLLEWLASPIVYYAYAPFVDELRAILQEFDVKAVMLAYANMALKQHKKEQAGSGEQIIGKKYLYAIRPILAVLHLHAYPERLPPLTLADLAQGVSHVPEVAAIGADFAEILALKRQDIDRVSAATLQRLDGFIASMVPKVRDLANASDSSQAPDPLRIEQLSIATIKHFFHS